MCCFHFLLSVVGIVLTDKESSPPEANYIPFKGACTASLDTPFIWGPSPVESVCSCVNSGWIPVRVLSLRKPTLQAVPRPAACCGSLGEAGGKM